MGTEYLSVISGVRMAVILVALLAMLIIACLRLRGRARVLAASGFALILAGELLLPLLTSLLLARGSFDNMIVLIQTTGFLGSLVWLSGAALLVLAIGTAQSSAAPRWSPPPRPDNYGPAEIDGGLR